MDQSQGEKRNQDLIKTEILAKPQTTANPRHNQPRNDGSSRELLRRRRRARPLRQVYDEGGPLQRPRVPRAGQDGAHHHRPGQAKNRPRHRKANQGHLPRRQRPERRRGLPGGPVHPRRGH